MHLPPATPSVPQQPAALPASATPQPAGQFRGEAALPLPPGGLDASDMEEISLHFAERAEQEALDEEPVQAHGQPLVMTAEQVLAYLQATHQQAETGKLVALARRMLVASGHPGVMARQDGGDPTRQHLALQYALDEGRRQGADPARLQALQDALADLDEDHGELIRARLNTAAVAASQGADAAAVQSFQQTYSDLVLGAPTLAQTLQQALARFGAAAFAPGLQGLIAALGADLAATRPSTSPVRLQALLQDLYQLQVVHTTLDAAQELADALVQRHGAVRLDAAGLVQELVAVSAERWIAASRFEALADRLGVTGTAARIGLLTGIKALLRDLPERVFVDAEARQTVRAAVQDALDAAIASEEDA